MSHITRPNKSRLLAVAAAMSTAGFLLALPPAQAEPSCLQFSFLGDFNLKQRNGYTVSFILQRTSGLGRGGRSR